MTKAAQTLVRMLETLPEPAQDRVVETLAESRASAAPSARQLGAVTTIVTQPTARSSSPS